MDRERIDFEYLGPHCCRRGGTVRAIERSTALSASTAAGPVSRFAWTQVYRAYDTRFRFTDRRPNLYAIAAQFYPEGAAPEEPSVEVVCRLSDCAYAPAGNGDGGEIGCDVKLRDRRVRPEEDAAEMEWMWNKEVGKLEGELVVLAIPYVSGNHCASEMKDFIPVIRSLQKMHDAGYVHGDIRCFNIVFGKCLIDFDFGGKADDDDTTYPARYVQALRDGYRIGVEGDKIAKWHDWFALIKVMFSFHAVEPPMIALNEAEMNEIALIIGLQQRQKEFRLLLNRYRARSPEPDEEELKELPEKLIQFLKDAEDANWTVEPDDSLKNALEDY
jgi:hypothetical protein